MSQLENNVARYAIIGFGPIGQALAKAFARKGIAVAVTTTRDPQSFAAEAAAIGPEVIPATLAEAVQADILFLAVGFRAHAAVAQALPTWRGKTIVDVTNAYGIPLAQLGGLPSAQIVAQAFTDGSLVKGFNHVSAAVLGQDPAVQGGRRVVYLASDEDEATAQIGALAEQLGFSPIQLGRLAEGGLLVQAHDRSWGHLIFKDLVNFK